jgi:cell division protein FtsA
LRTGLSARVGHPTEQLAHGYDHELASPVFATAVGLVVKGFQELAKEDLRNPAKKQPAIQQTAASNPKQQPEPQAETIETEKKTGIFGRLFQKTKAWFEADPDSNL